MRGSRVFRLFFLLSAFCLLPSLLFAEPTVVKRLDNGLTIVFKENHSAPVVAVRVYVKTGSMLEGKYAGAGISHVLEHLVHGAATPKRSEAEGRKLLESIGNNSNAFTSKEMTCYFINTASRYFDTALDLLSDWVGNATFPQADFDRELAVVQRELEKDRVEPRWVIYDTFDRMMFQVAPWGLPTIGYLDILRGVTRDEIIAYYHRTYAPGNMIVAVAGDVTPDEAVKKIASYFGKIPGRPLLVEALPQEPPQLAPREQVKEMDVKIAYMHMGWRSVPISSPDMYPLDLLSNILTNGDSSRLVRIIKDEKLLVHGITSYSFTPDYDGGQFVISCTLDPDRIEETRKAVLEQIEAVKRRPVTSEELAKAKRQKVAENVFGRQTAEDQASDIGANLLYTSAPDFSDLYVANIQKVTAGQIRDAAQRYFTDDALCVAIVCPKAAATAKAVAPAEAIAPKAEKIVLPNGLRVILKRAPSVPLVAMQAYWLAGVRFENEKNNGISRFTAEMMLKGTRKRTAQQIAEIFDSMGGDINVASGNNAMFLTSTVLKENFATALDVCEDVLQNPTFPPDEVEKMRLNLLAAIRAQDDSWFGELGHFFRTHFFKVSPYRLDPIGSTEAVKALTQKDLREWHAAWCAPNNMVLAVVGDIDPKAAREQIEKAFAVFPAKQDLKLPTPPTEPPLTKDETFTKYTQKQQAAMYIGFSGMTLKDLKDRYPMDVLNGVIAGIEYPTGWLFNTLRGQGLVYVAAAHNWVGLEPGYFGAYAACEPSKADEVIKIMLQKFEDAKDDKITDEEFERSKRMCITTHELGLQRPSSQAGAMALDELYGLGYDFGDKYAAAISAVTKTDVKRVAEKYFTKHVICLTTPKK